jgi:hypothetical protein
MNNILRACEDLYHSLRSKGRAMSLVTGVTYDVDTGKLVVHVRSQSVRRRLAIQVPSRFREWDVEVRYST